MNHILKLASQPSIRLQPLYNIKGLSRSLATSQKQNSELSSESPQKPQLLDREFTQDELEILKPMLRVNQAGEIGANYIYMGQYLVFRNDPKLEPLIKHMWDQEKVHLEKFNSLIPQYQARPTALTPIWRAAGLALGISTALMGKEAAMACTEAVETVIGQHYNDQLRDLAVINTSEASELKKIIVKFRDEELEHLETAVQHDSHKAPFYEGLNQVIQTGCKAAIWVATRI